MKANKKRITRHHAELFLYVLSLTFLLLCVHSVNKIKTESTKIQNEIVEMRERVHEMRKTNADILAEFGIDTGYKTNP